MTGTYLRAGDFILDMNEGVAFPLNFSIADSKDPEKRKRSLSRSVSFSGTINNMRFFSSAYSLSLTDVERDGVGFDFDPTQRVEVRYYKNSILVFDGLMRLDEVTKQNGNYTFSCTMFSNFVDLFLSLGDRTVADLGWSEYNHDLTIENVKKSWDTSVFVNGVETPNFSGGAPLGFGYLYPLVDYAYNSISTTFAINNLVPMVYVKEVIEKCFAVAGTTINSDWLNSERVRKMVYAFGGGRRKTVTSEEINRRLVVASSDYSRIETQVGVNDPHEPDPDRKRYIFNAQPNESRALIGETSTYLTTTVTQDDSSAISGANLNIVGASGNYKLVVNGFIQQEMIISTGVFSSGYHGFRVQFMINGQLIDSVQVLEHYGATTVGLNYNRTFEFNIPSNGVNTISLQVLRRNYLTVEGGDSIQFETTTPTPISYTMTCENGSLLDGDEVNITPAIGEIKASVFLSGIIKAHNLYLTDPDIYNEVALEPLDDFMQPTTEFDDWTDLVAPGQPQKIVPAANISGKNYVFSFEQEDDYLNKVYQDEFGSRYGNETITVESKYQAGDREYKLPFGQAVPTKIVGSDIVLPSIKKQKPDGSFEPYAGKPKIYFYNGLKSGDFRITNVAGDTYEDLTSYPCVHHMDDFENPTFDWNWALPQKIYYGNLSTIVTTNNLLSAYHLKFIRELTGRDSKFYRLFVKLSPAHINSLSFSKLKMIDGVLFRLNEIKDFDSDIAESTFVELIRIIEGDSPPVFTGEVSASSSVTSASLFQSARGVGMDVGVFSGNGGLYSQLITG